MTTIAAQKENTFGALIMVTGCCIGAGMIGLPVLSAAAGFLPSSVAMLVSYLFTTLSGLLLVEATLWFKDKVNLFTIAHHALGRPGKFAIGALFLFLFYTIFVAYLDAGSQLLGFKSRSLGMILTALLVSGLVYRGIKSVDWVNRILLIGLAVSYLLLTILGLPHVDLKNLTYINWAASLGTLPILFICFGFQNLVPSLTHYLHKNVSAIRFSIIVGNLLPFLFYLLWNFTTLGLISNTELANSSSGMVTELFASQSPSLSISFLVQTFSFFALFTSFITVAVSFVDFIRDAFRQSPQEWILHLLVFGPPLAIALTYPHLFLRALDFAGGFIDLLLFGIMPVLIVWIGRYVKKTEGPYRVAGGKPLLIAIFLFSATLISLRLF
jgi:tyrosine-specific transport protein